MRVSVVQARFVCQRQPGGRRRLRRPARGPVDTQSGRKRET